MSKELKWPLCRVSVSVLTASEYLYKSFVSMYGNYPTSYSLVRKVTWMVSYKICTTHSSESSYLADCAPANKA